MQLERKKSGARAFLFHLGRAESPHAQVEVSARSAKDCPKKIISTGWQWWSLRRPRLGSPCLILPSDSRPHAGDCRRDCPLPPTLCTRNPPYHPLCTACIHPLHISFHLRPHRGFLSLRLRRAPCLCLLDSRPFFHTQW